MRPTPSRSLAWLSRNAVWIAVVSGVTFAAISVLHWRLTGFVIMADFLDLTVYEAGARALVDGVPLYEAKIDGNYSFVYPPFAAVLFTPMVLGPLWLWKLLVFPVNIALLAGVVWMSLRVTGQPANRDTARVAVALTSLLFWLEPVAWTMHLGQINLVLLTILVFGVFRWAKDPSAGSELWLGVAVGLTAGIKLTPAIFVLFFLVIGRYRAVITAVATFLATVVVGWAVTPGDSVRYWSGTFLRTDRIGELSSPMNLSLNGLIARLFNTNEPPTLVWLGVALLVTFVGFLFAVRAHRCGETLLGFTLIGMNSVAVSPYSWSHHWVWFVPLVVVAAREFRDTRRHTAALAVFAVVTFAWPMHLVTGHRMDISALGVVGVPEWHGLGNVYTNVYVFLFGATLLWARRRLGARDGALAGS